MATYAHYGYEVPWSSHYGDTIDCASISEACERKCVGYLSYSEVEHLKELVRHLLTEHEVTQDLLG